MRHTFHIFKRKTRKFSRAIMAAEFAVQRFGAAMTSLQPLPPEPVRNVQHGRTKGSPAEEVGLLR